MDNAEIKEMMKSNPASLVNIIEARVRKINYLEDHRRNDILDYIAAKVKGQISPHLRLARQVRRGHYFKWLEFQKLLEYFKLTDTLTRENNYQPIPEWVINHPDSLASVQLEKYIDFFNYIHAQEDERYEKIFVRSFNDWVKPALLYAFDKVDTTKSEREVVSYICKAFYTAFIKNRADSQGLHRVRRGGEWRYYTRKPINEFEFRESDVLETIFHRPIDLPIEEMALKLTKNQNRLLVRLHDYVRKDVKELSDEDFYEKYKHGHMHYGKTAEEMRVSYASFVKNIERIKKKVS